MLNEFERGKSIILRYYKKLLKCVMKGSEHFVEKGPNSLTIIISTLVDIYFLNIISILVFFNEKYILRSFLNCFTFQGLCSVLRFKMKN